MTARETLRTIVRDAAQRLPVVHVTEEYRPNAPVTALCGVRLSRAVGMHVPDAGLERCDGCTRALLASPMR